MTLIREQEFLLRFKIVKGPYLLDPFVIVVESLKIIKFKKVFDKIFNNRLNEIIQA